MYHFLTPLSSHNPLKSASTPTALGRLPHDRTLQTHPAGISLTMAQHPVLLTAPLNAIFPGFPLPALDSHLSLATTKS